ncbi:hypothetical protein [Alteraurantiacibacter aquimixticola]|uniref:Uncharacterized protein n=1 Tax=Alteraurantiacibacter aquimixticola TaxID=2489173 RepID=A0A4T3EY35_9SPHN|nr:hypothetical protein [Alteraurantiacibacter aquimixticola]TIX48961.1 hypothetical protein E5222_14595 [Alteraurantiacibacter aquimixticola]
MFKSALACVAAAGLVLAPVAASANTRAADNAVSLASIAQGMDRSASPIGESENLKGKSEWLLVLLFGGLAAAIVLLIEDGEKEVENGASPGTGS